jgi:hypothetical protein
LRYIKSLLIITILLAASLPYASYTSHNKILADYEQTLYFDKENGSTDSPSFYGDGQPADDSLFIKPVLKLLALLNIGNGICTFPFHHLVTVFYQGSYL